MVRDVLSRGYTQDFECAYDERGHYPEFNTKPGDDGNVCHFCGAVIFRNAETRRWFSAGSRYIIAEEPY